MRRHVLYTGSRKLHVLRNYGWRAELSSDGCYVIRTDCSALRVTAGEGAGDVSGAGQQGK